MFILLLLFFFSGNKSLAHSFDCLVETVFKFQGPMDIGFFLVKFSCCDMLKLCATVLGIQGEDSNRINYNFFLLINSRSCVFISKSWVCLREKETLEDFGLFDPCYYYLLSYKVHVVTWMRRFRAWTQRQRCNKMNVKRIGTIYYRMANHLTDGYFSTTN